MFETLRNGFRLGSATRKLVFKDRRLFIYPILIGIIAFAELVVLVAGSIVFSAALGAGSLLPFIVVGGLLFYFVSSFAATYITIAMLINFRSLESGQEEGVLASLSNASQYTKLALEWSLFYATVILLLNIVESRFRGISNLTISSIGSFAISVATMFAVPIIVDRKTGPMKTIEASAETLMSHFGATFGGMAYSELLSLGLVILGILVSYCGWLAFLGIGVAGIVIAVAGLCIFVFGIMLGFSLSTVFKFVLYEYANGKPLPEGFDEKMIKDSTKQKKAPII